MIYAVLCEWFAVYTNVFTFVGLIEILLPVYFAGDTKSRGFLLSGVYARVSKISHQSALEMCNLPWTPHSSLEKDNSVNHSYVSPNMGCLEYT